MGYSMSTQSYRFTAWVDFDLASNTTAWANPAFELYDHLADPDENLNLAVLPEYTGRVEEHFSQLKAGWRATHRGFTSARLV